MAGGSQRGSSSPSPIFISFWDFLHLTHEQLLLTQIAVAASLSCSTPSLLCFLGGKDSNSTLKMETFGSSG